MECAAGKYKGAPGSAACTGCPAGAESDAGSTGSSSCKCKTGSSLQPVKAAAHVQLSDDSFRELEPGRFADLDLSQGVAVSVSWETRAFEVHDAAGAEVATLDRFRGLTTVLVGEDFVGALTYTCRGCSGAGSINLVPAVHECVADAEVGDAFHRVFATRGSLDNARSCRVQCVAGFYRTHSLPGWRCEAHWNPVCGVREFLVRGTPENNAYCRPCSGCAGKRLERNCSAESDDECADCGAAGEIWTNAHGEPCKQGCGVGFVLDRRAGVCEPCLHRCPAGYGFPLSAERANCTHCAACEELPGTPPRPAGAEWDRAEDRVDCVATCTAGYSLVEGASGGLECAPSTRRSASLENEGPSSAPAARCAEAGCLLPGCTLHEGACTACFDLPDELQRGRFGLEQQELLPGRGLYSAGDKNSFRWQFLAGCEWACLSPWTPIQSEDGRYWKCETRVMVDSILALDYWDPGFGKDSAGWVDAKGDPAAATTHTVGTQFSNVFTAVVFFFNHHSSSVILVAALACPFAVLVSVVCITFARECCRGRPRKKHKV
jgi:hypothetical protein